MPSPPRSVLDGLESLWDRATQEWRAANARREEAEALKAQAATEMMDRAKLRLADLGQEVQDSRVARVVDALFGNRESDRPERGPVDRAVVADRVRRTRNDVRNIGDAARMSGDPVVMAAAWPAAAGIWLDRVRPRGAWDDKAHHSGPTALYERQGNFSYGATAAALGLSREAALRGAGAAQRWQAVRDALQQGARIRERKGLLSPPYGDDPRDQPVISEGYGEGRRLVGR
jgi:hypothetical protein